MPGHLRCFRHRPVCLRRHTFTPSALGYVSATPDRIVSTSDSPGPCLLVSWKAVSACGSARPFRSGAGHCSFKGGGRQRAHLSGNFQLTLRLEVHGIIPCCSEALPTSPDVVSPFFLIRRGPKSHRKRSPENPAGALKLPLRRWKSAQGGPEDGTTGVLALGLRRPPLPRGPKLDPGSSRSHSRGCRRSPPCRRAAALI